MAIFRGSTAKELERAKLAGEARASAPRVIAAEYDEARDRLSLEFDRGFAVSVSIRALSDFQGASAHELGVIEILGSGDAIHFSRIDRSLSVANLLAQLLAPLTSSANRRLRADNQLSVRVQGGYVVATGGGPPPPAPKGGSSVRRPKA